MWNSIASRPLWRCYKLYIHVQSFNIAKTSLLLSKLCFKTIGYSNSFIFLLNKPYSRKRSELLPFDRLTVPTRCLCCALFQLLLFAQADLRLQWAYSHFVGFVMRRLIWHAYEVWKSRENWYGLNHEKDSFFVRQSKLFKKAKNWIWNKGGRCKRNEKQRAARKYWKYVSSWK